MEAKRILVVEDESIVALDIQESLKNLGYSVIDVVDRGEDAMRRADETKPDLVLMDIRLKGDIDGIVAAAYVRDKLGLPVVFLTAYADEATLQRAKITDPYGYILKPFEEVDLRTAVELALHRHSMELELKAARDGGKREAEPSNRSRELNSIANFDVSSTAQLSPLEFLQKIKLFSAISPAQLKQFAQSCSFGVFDAGDFIAYEGDDAPSGFIVASGRVAMLKTSASGKELIVELLPPGDIFGLIPTLEKQPNPLTARAQTGSRILWIPSAVLSLLLNDNPLLYRELTEHVTNRLRASHNSSRRLAHDRVEIRIASTLTALVPQFATVDKTQEYYTIQITRQELADLTGTSPETAIRVTKNMEREGMLDLTRPGIIKIKDLDRLKELVEDETW